MLVFLLLWILGWEDTDVPSFRLLLWLYAAWYFVSFSFPEGPHILKH